MNRLSSHAVTWLTIAGACGSGLLLMAATQRPDARPLGLDRTPAALRVACSASGPGAVASAAVAPVDATLAGLEAPAALALAR